VRLKIITAFFLAGVIFLLAVSGFVIGPVPKKSAPREVKRLYGVRTLNYLGLLIFAFTGSGVGSFLVLRRARDEYREDSLKNLQYLLEATAKSVKNSADEPKSD
jgi:hypothetical protein